jgi:hypothetical protein
MGSRGSLVNVNVAPQINTQIGLNLAVLSPGATQSLGQVGNNNANANAGLRRR